jgi:hypothetical protein
LSPLQHHYAQRTVEAIEARIVELALSAQFMRGMGAGAGAGARARAAAQQDRKQAPHDDGNRLNLPWWEGQGGPRKKDACPDRA